MKKINKLLLSACAAVLVLNSCSIEKRLHNRGYHVSWKQKIHAANEPRMESVAEDNLKKSRTEEEQSAVSEVEELPVIVKSLSENVASTEQSTERPLQKRQEQILTTVKSAPDMTVREEKVTPFTKAAEKKAIQKVVHEKPADDTLILLYILCFLVPVIAVGVVTDWSLLPVLLSVLLMIVFWVPAIIHAIIVVHNNW